MVYSEYKIDYIAEGILPDSITSICISGLKILPSSV